MELLLILEAEINSFESEIVSVIRLISILIVSVIESEIVREIGLNLVGSNFNRPV
jgi:hypothetical protein